VVVWVGVVLVVLGGGLLGLLVGVDDFTTHSRGTTIQKATNDVEVVLPIVLELLRSFAAPRPVRLLGVRVAGLDEEQQPAKEDSAQMALPL
jgi:DNA polymerase-4